MAEIDNTVFDYMNEGDPYQSITGGAIEYSEYEMDMTSKEKKGYEKDLMDALSMNYRSDPDKGKLSFANWLKELKPDLIMGRARKWEELREDAKGAEEYRKRMDALDQSYDLDDQDREFLAKELKTLEEEEEFASFASKLEVLWKHKNKEVQASFNDEIQKRIDEEVAKRVANASTEGVEVEKALDEAEEVDAAVPNVNEAVASKEESLIDKFKGAFKRENIEIS